MVEYEALITSVIVGVIVSVATYFITKSLKRMEKVHNEREADEKLFNERIHALENICRDLLYSRIRQIYGNSIKKTHITLDELREVFILIESLKVIDSAEMPLHMLEKLKAMPQGTPPEHL